MVLETHRAVGSDAVTKATPQKRFQQALKLGRLKVAWEAALQMKETASWKALGLAALEGLDMDMALAAFRWGRTGCG